MGLFSYLDEKYKHLRRYNQIISVLFKYGFEDAVSYMEEKKRFTFLKKLIPKATYQQATFLSKWEKMRLVCEELGPTFVKFGQILSNRPDLLPAELIKELEKLQDSVPPMSEEIAVSTVETELKKKTSELFATFDTKPLASASMAQVHRATLNTGEKVVVKIQRPGIKEMIEEDVKVMLYMAEIFSKRIPSLKSFDPVGLVRNFEISIRQELDFIHESINVQRFHKNFTDDPKDEGYVHSPEIYRDYTTEKVLTIEFVDGIKISDIQKLKDKGYDTSLLARRLAVSYIRQVFRYGFFHADPHPGNLFVLPNNVVCYIDYGMMGSILMKDVEALGSLYLSVKAKDIRKIIRALQQLSDNANIRNLRALEVDLDEFVNNYSVQSIHDNEMSTLLLELRDIIIKHGLKVPTHFFLLARSMVTIEGVIRNLDPTIDLTSIARPYFIRIVAKKLNPLNFAQKIFNSVYEMGMYMEEFPRDLKNAIRKINTGEIKVDLRHKGIDPLVHTFNRVTKQIVSAVVLSALIIGASMLIAANIQPLWRGYSVMGIVGYSIAAFIALGMMKNLGQGDHDEWQGWDEEN